MSIASVHLEIDRKGKAQATDGVAEVDQAPAEAAEVVSAEGVAATIRTTAHRVMASALTEC